MYHSHRIMWALAHGRDPGDMLVDHIVPLKEGGLNHPMNLQLVTHRLNLTKDLKRELPTGVYSASKRFEAKIRVGGKRFHLGTFDTPELAGAAYQEALARLLSLARPAVDSDVCEHV
jgi:hypothetical protein